MTKKYKFYPNLAVSGEAGITFEVAVISGILQQRIRASFSAVSIHFDNNDAVHNQKVISFLINRYILFFYIMDFGSTPPIKKIMTDLKDDLAPHKLTDVCD